ncbi:hypothetical protein SH661x_001627 [Planctomicrobium sp. SH661]|uniref:hypothetical protein n=1 Tax=Planctomicrobium sp. SH661 TaxID=3448124 RepID=UPI003F5B7512
MYFLDMANGWAEYFLSFLPNWSGTYSSLISWFATINGWVPVDVFLWCGFTYVMFCACIAGFRFVKSMVPTLGG